MLPYTSNNKSESSILFFTGLHFPPSNVPVNEHNNMYFRWLIKWLIMINLIHYNGLELIPAHFIFDHTRPPWGKKKERQITTACKLTLLSQIFHFSFLVMKRNNVVSKRLYSTFPLSSWYWWIFHHLSECEVRRDALNHLLTFLNSRKERVPTIIRHHTLGSALYKVVFSIQQVSSCFFTCAFDWA